MTHKNSILLKITFITLLLSSFAAYGGLLTVTVDWSNYCAAGSEHSTSDCVFNVKYDDSATSASLYTDGANGVGEFGYGDDVWVANVIAPGASFISQGIVDLSTFYNVIESQVRAENPSDSTVYNFNTINSALLTDTYSYVYNDSTGLNLRLKKDSFSFEFNFDSLLGSYEVLDVNGNTVLDRGLNLDRRGTVISYQGEIIFAPIPGEPTPPPATIPETNPPAPVSEPEPPIISASTPPVGGLLFGALILILSIRTCIQ
jgi:hypothetical protein